MQIEQSKQKIIVLRGPSGAGKSTIATRIVRESKRDVMKVVQDLYRKRMTRNSDSHELRRDMILRDCLYALDNGYDVVLDGIFNIRRHKVLLDELIAKHPHENYIYYFDIPFDETLRRHGTRDKAQQFGADEMADWYSGANPSGYDGEVVIPADMSEDDILKLIDKQTGILG